MRKSIPIMIAFSVFGASVALAQNTTPGMTTGAGSSAKSSSSSSSSGGVPPAPSAIASRRRAMCLPMQKTTIRNLRRTKSSIARSRASAAAAEDWREIVLAPTSHSAQLLQAFLAASAIPIRDVPPNTRLMPTSSPIAQAADPGSPATITAATRISRIPAARTQPQRPDNLFLCSSAYMMVATPSARKYAPTTMVSVSVPATGLNTKMKTGDDRENGREQRPPEAGHLSRGERHVETDGAADQKHPSQEDGDSDTCERRNGNRRETEDHEDDPLDQEALPMGLHGFLHLRLKTGDILRHAH